MLTQMRDISNLMVDLAYSSVIFGSQPIAEEVEELESRIDKKYTDIRLKALEYAKEAKDPKKLLSIFQIAHAMEEISDSANNIAEVVLRDIDLHPILKEAIEHSDEIIKPIKIKKGSNFSNKTIRELKVETVTGLLIIAIKRDGSYIYGPDADQKLLDNDILIVRGAEAGLQKLKDLISTED